MLIIFKLFLFMITRKLAQLEMWVLLFLLLNIATWAAQCYTVVKENQAIFTDTFLLGTSK